MTSLDHHLDTPAGTARCSACGGTIPTGAAFCNHCGVATTTQPPERPAPPPASEETTAAWPGTHLPVGAGPDLGRTPQRRHPRTTIVVAIATGLLFLALVVTAVVLLARILPDDGDVPLFGDDGFESWGEVGVDEYDDPTGIVDSWQQTAAEISADWTGGEHRQYLCPAGGRPFPVWGTDLYTHDSSICTAAVHAGFIDLEVGGAVQIELLPGRSSYVGSLRNGVRTDDWGEWPQSFQVVAAAPLESAE